MNNVKQVWCGGNGTRRDRTPRFPHLSSAPKASSVVAIYRGGTPVEVEAATFIRFRRRFPGVAFRIEIFRDMPDGTSEYSYTDTRTGVDFVRKIGNN